MPLTASRLLLLLLLLLPLPLPLLPLLLHGRKRVSHCPELFCVLVLRLVWFIHIHVHVSPTACGVSTL